jgi:hypothetical protein
VLNNDMMGWSNDHRLDNTIRYSNPGLRDLQHAAAIGFSSLITYDAFYYKSTDAQALLRRVGRHHRRHRLVPDARQPALPSGARRAGDDQSSQLVAETSKTTIASIMLMASSPSRG